MRYSVENLLTVYRAANNPEPFWAPDEDAKEEVFRKLDKVFATCIARRSFEPLIDEQQITRKRLESYPENKEAPDTLGNKLIMLDAAVAAVGPRTARNRGEE